MRKPFSPTVCCEIQINVNFGGGFIISTKLSKSTLLLTITIICSIFLIYALASGGDRASATPSLYKRGTALSGGVVVFGGYDFVPEIRAYFELYRDNVYIGSKLDVSENYYLDQFATASITEGVHTQSGLYLMKWSGRVKEYNFNGSDWSQSGEKTYYLN